MTSANENFVHLSSNYLDSEFIFRKQLLDIDEDKEAREKRVYVKVCIDDLLFLIPLRSNISNLTKNSALKNCFFEVPSSTRPNAGLDFTKAVLVENEDLIECDGAFAHSQKQRILSNYSLIESMYKTYYERFKKSLKKNRTDRDQEFKYCVLRNHEDKIRCKIT